MQEILAEGGVELVGVLGQALVAAALTLAGMAIELNALNALAAGDMIVGAWTLYMGGLALYAGLFVVGSDVLSKLGGQSTETA